MSTIALGIFQNTPSPMVSRYLGRLGWEWVVLDMQHGPMNFETLYECIHVLRGAGVRPFVRVSIGNPSEVQRVLDLGAAGVIVPMVNSRQEAELCAAAAKFPPAGARSFGGDFAYHFGPEYPATANADTKLFVQMEHTLSADAIEQIMAVDGVDGCLIGPTDLALSLGLGYSGFETQPQHRQAIQRTLDVCLRLGKIPVINAYSLADAKERMRAGFQWITVRSDTDLFMDAGKNLLNELKALRTEAAV